MNRQSIPALRIHSCICQNKVVKNIQLENAEILGKADLSITLKTSSYHGAFLLFFFESKARKTMLLIYFRKLLYKGKKKFLGGKTFNEHLYGPAKQIHKENVAKTEN